MKESAYFPGEYLLPRPRILDPAQKRIVNNFLYGIGGLISGVFYGAVGGLPSYGTAITLVSAGMWTICNQVIEMYYYRDEKEARLKELEAIKKELEEVIQ